MSTSIANVGRERLLAVKRQSLSVALATGLYGVSFGALAVTSGLSFIQTMVLSLVMFSGGSQFAFLGVVVSGGSGFAAVLSAGLLGIRNGLYGPLVSPLLEVKGWRQAAAIQLTIDESTAVATSQPDQQTARTGFWWTGIGVYVLWNVLVAAGAALGDQLGDPRRFGLDAAAAAAFLGLLWPRLSAGDLVVKLTAGLGAAAALVAAITLPPGAAVLVAAALALTIAWVRSKKADSSASGEPSTNQRGGTVSPATDSCCDDAPTSGREPI